MRYIACYPHGLPRPREAADSERLTFDLRLLSFDFCPSTFDFQPFFVPLHCD